MSCNMLYHVCLLAERSITNVTNKRFFSCVDLEMLLEVEPFAVNQETTYRATLVFRPMIIHVKVKVFQISCNKVALDTLDGPVIILDFYFIIGDDGVIGRCWLSW